MKLTALLLLAAGASAAASQREAEAGPVYLLSAGLPTAGPAFEPLREGPGVLLVAAAPDSPAPLDARAWGANARTAILDVQQSRVRGLDGAQLDRLRSAQQVFLGPGSVQQWAAVLGAGTKPTPVAAALLEAWRSGAAVVATGDAAVVLAAGYPDEPDERERNPRALDRARLAPGLGLLNLFVLDTAAHSQGRLERLVTSVLSDGADLALYLPAQGALRFDPRSGDLLSLGVEPVLIFDARRARRTSRSLNLAELVFVQGPRDWNRHGTPDQRAARASAPAARLQAVEDLWSASAWTAAADQGRRSFSLTTDQGRVDFRPLQVPEVAFDARGPAVRGLLDISPP